MAAMRSNAVMFKIAESMHRTIKKSSRGNGPSAIANPLASPGWVCLVFVYRCNAIPASPGYRPKIALLRDSNVTLAQGHMLRN